MAQMRLSPHCHARSFAVALALLAGLLAPRLASGFCGFYVAGADTQLYNNATMVVMMREGTRTVLSMQNNYQGPAGDFAMVVPMPVVLQKENVKTLAQEVFDRVDKLASPRLVEYWEQDPCMELPKPKVMSGIGRGGGGTGSGYGVGSGRGSEVKVEAEFSVGEYEIVILSATDALALETWLSGNGYKIPADAAPYLRPYVERGQKFFVAKVDVSKVTYKDGMAKLSPLRMHYDSEDFSLPVRLGLINARDAQDLIVHILARNQRYQVANYANVTIPTNLSVRDEVRTRFGEFYAALFDATLSKNPGAVVTEYAWDSGTCDPCPDSPVTAKELYTLGLDVLDQGTSQTAQPMSARVRMGALKVVGALDKNIIRRYLRRAYPRFRACHAQALGKDRSFLGNVTMGFTIDANGRVQKERVEKAPAGAARAGFDKCVSKILKSVRFPKPKGGGINLVTANMRLVAGSRGMRGFVLTRLHARYTRENLGEDLVFKVAEPIRGGQGGGMPAEKAAVAATRNTFQGRYIIHHEWTGAMTCKSPRRGNWGGPPAGQKSDTAIARDLAFAPRGKIALSSMVAEPVAALGAAPRPATDTAVVEVRPDEKPTANGDGSSLATEATPEPGKRSRGCGVARSDSDEHGDWWLWLLLAWIGLPVVRRSSAGRPGVGLVPVHSGHAGDL